MQVLEYMHHEHKLIHRDIKPSSFVIDENFRIKLISFGQSKKYDPNIDLYKLLDLPLDEWSDESYDLTPGAWVGTMAFRSPELVTHDVSSPALDLWALGCTLFFMLTKELPFKASNSFDIQQKIGQD